ncbi:hypothetical protein V8G54_029826 [Vigna mungo]|uniref:Uncharacterized protein n=1 Tax=Vigna mungo TaxID=3915 RepID=A0AAQ3RN13_VIGMU
MFTVSRPISPDSFIPHITSNAKLTPFRNPSVPRTVPCLVQHKFFTNFLFLRPFARRDATITREDLEDSVPNKHCSAMSMLTRNSCFRLVLLKRVPFPPTQPPIAVGVRQFIERVPLPFTYPFLLSVRVTNLEALQPPPRFREGSSHPHILPRAIHREA